MCILLMMIFVNVWAFKITLNSYKEVQRQKLEVLESAPMPSVFAPLIDPNFAP